MLTLPFATARPRTPAPRIDANWVASGLRMRVLVPFVIGLLLLLGTLASMDIAAHQRETEAEAERLAATMQARVTEQTESSVQTMRSILELLLADEHLVAAMRAGSREQLATLADPVFRGLRARNKISHMYFIQPDRTVLLRVHAPHEFGDRVNRVSLLRAERTQAPAWLNEQGTLGNFTLRLVYPWFQQGRLIGYMELGIEIEDILRELKQSLGAELFVTIDKSRLDHAKWEATQATRPPERRVSWNEFPETVMITRTTPRLPPQLRSFLARPAVADGEQNFELDDGDRVAQVVSIPLALGGRDVGRLAVMVDTTEHATAKHAKMRIMFASGLLIGGVLTAFFYILLGRVQQDVAARTARLDDARTRLAQAQNERLRAEDELHSEQERNELLEARSRMVEELAAATQTAQAALRDNEEITRKLRETQGELVATARQAGRAEIATNVLHNVGNVLNSVNTSAGLIGSTLRRSRLAGLSRGLRMLEQHGDDAGTFLSQDEKGKLLPGYLVAAGDALATEHQGMAQELERLTKSLDHIKDIVATQQSHATGGHVIERVKPADLAEDALRMQSSGLARHEVEVVREFGTVPDVPLDRGRVLQILVNLISNAKAAMQGVASGSRRLTLRVDMAGAERLRFAVSDVGEGIPQENLTRIFAHGFTTRRDGHGFGLHSSALAARELGGTLTVASEGPGKGATFTLELRLPPVAA